MEEIRGLVFNVQRFAIHDGPGIRTTLFLKGCPLDCWWCHNPESISPRPEIAFFDRRCIGCGRCFEVCAAGAHVRLPDGRRARLAERCTLCGRCAEGCCSGALVVEGRRMAVDEAVAVLSRDAPFYANSGGGVSLSGGEPMMQSDFTAAVLRRCREAGLHTVLDTCGFAPWDDFQRVLPWVDLVLFDLKMADPEAHRTYTGVSNETILENLRRMDELGTAMEIRIPVIPGVNDARPRVEALARVTAGLRHPSRVTFLPYHRLGEAKYARLGRICRLPGLEPPDEARMAEIAAWFHASDLQNLDSRRGAG